MCFSIINQRCKIPEEHGSLVVEFEGLTSSGRPLKTTLVGWKGAKTIRAYVNVDECVHTLRLLGEDVTKYGKEFTFALYLINHYCVQ